MTNTKCHLALKDACIYVYFIQAAHNPTVELLLHKCNGINHNGELPLMNELLLPFQVAHQVTQLAHD